MIERAKIVMDTPLGEVTISGSYRVVMEVQKRCNAHDKLLKALDAAHEYLTDQAANMDVNGASISAELALLLVKLEQAIALAEGEGSDTAQSS